MTLLMSKWGIKITKQGKNIDSETPTDFVFNTKYPPLNVKLRGSINISTTAGSNPAPTTTVTYNHNFGYKPQFMVFTEPYMSSQFDAWGIENYTNLNLELIVNDVGADVYETLRAYVTDTSLVITAQLAEVVSGDSTSIVHDYTMNFILFMEEAV